MTYSIGYRASAERNLLRLDAAVRIRVIAAIDKLADNPRPPGCKKLRGMPGFRIRVGDYRVVYAIHDRIIAIEIIDVGHRGDVYR